MSITATELKKNLPLNASIDDARLERLEAK